MKITNISLDKEVEENIRKWKNRSYIDDIRIFPIFNANVVLLISGVVIFLSFMVAVANIPTPKEHIILQPVVQKTTHIEYDNGWNSVILSDPIVGNKTNLLEDPNGNRYLCVGASIISIEKNTIKLEK